VCGGLYGEGGTEEKRVVRDTKNQFHIILTLQKTNEKFVGSSGI
jgi:hypothetical protein